jgi:ribosome-binding protein aMBF1 (putative translation factor)
MNIPKNKRNHLSFENAHKEFMKNSEFRKAYKAVQPEMNIIRALIDARIAQEFTQEEIAKMIETKQPVISRLESGKTNPTVGFLRKLANALNADLEIKFIPR